MPEKVWKQYCPLMKGVCINGFVKGMPENETGERTVCAFFMTIAGQNHLGEKVNDPGCAIQWMPIVFLEGNQFLRNAVASVDKVATEVRRQQAIFVGALPDEARQRLMDADPRMALPGKESSQNNDETQGSPT